MLHVKNVDLLQVFVTVTFLIVSHVVVLYWLVKDAFVHQCGVPAFRAQHESADVGDAHLKGQQHQVHLQADILAARQHFVFGNLDIQIGQQLIHFLNS